MLHQDRRWSVKHIWTHCRQKNIKPSSREAFRFHSQQYKHNHQSTEEQEGRNSQKKLYENGIFEMAHITSSLDKKCVVELQKTCIVNEGFVQKIYMASITYCNVRKE